MTYLDSETSQLKNPNFVSLPRYWVSQSEVKRIVPAGHNWLLGFRDIADPGNERTAIFSILPLVATGNQLPLIFFKIDTRRVATFLANVNSFVFDYVARQKLGGNHMNLFIVKQLPVLPPTSYSDSLVKIISSKVLELVYCSWDIMAFAEEFGYTESNGKLKPPFEWNEENRTKIRCQLDAIYFILYGISKEDVDYILETFPIVKKREVQQFGEYRSKKLILKYFDEYLSKKGSFQF